MSVMYASTHIFGTRWCLTPELRGVGGRTPRKQAKAQPRVPSNAGLGSWLLTLLLILLPSGVTALHDWCLGLDIIASFAA